MRGANLGFWILALCVTAQAEGAAAGCKLRTIAELPVMMEGRLPMVPAKINGADVHFILDSGTFWSVIFPAEALELKLQLARLPENLRVYAVGGWANFSLTRVEDFRFAEYPMHKIDFLVGGNEIGGGAAGLLGQNILRIADVEYDLANGALRLMKPEGCGDATLAYWAGADPVSMIELYPVTLREPHTSGEAFLNGHRIRVIFDTGAQTSFVTRRAAEQAGVKLDDARVQATGVSFGVGQQAVRTWRAPFSSFKIGEEEIRNTALQIGDGVLPNADMLLGVDFFLSHRLYVATSQRKLYFTYNGGPVFRPAPLDASAAPPVALEAGIANPNPQPPAAPASAANGEPRDAAGFARRGAARAARREYAEAIQDLTRASELAPEEASYVYERGRVESQLKRFDLALADFDRALQLKPGDAEVRVFRASLRVQRHDTAGALADLDAADAALPKEANLHLVMGQLYGTMDRPESALVQLNEWIASHARDVRRAVAFGERCWVRALLNRELDQALSDCDAALALSPNVAESLDSRGLVYLRRGRWDRSIADYDAALKIRPTQAWSLYGRGIDKLRQGQAEAGQADLAAAAAASPGIAEEARKYGIAP